MSWEVRSRGAPLAQLPVVRAVLVPFGGLGTVALIDALAAAGL